MDEPTAHNPFVFATPLQSASELVGREGELDELASLARSGTYTLLEAPRRFGKTSLLVGAAERWRQETGGLAARVDFSRVLTAEEAARRVRGSYEAEVERGALAEILREMLRRIELRFGPVQLGSAPAPPIDQVSELHDLLEMPRQVAERTGRRSLIAFDEFQDVLAVEGLDGLLRSHLQHHQPHATYVFAGSEPSLLRELFSDRSRPLYAQAKPMRLGPIEPELFADEIARKFEATGKSAGDGGVAIAQYGGGHPQRTMLLAWHLWDLTAVGSSATRELGEGALGAALLDRQAELDAILRALPDPEQRVAIALAHGLRPTSAIAREQTGMSSRMVGSRGVKALLDRGHAEQRAGMPALVDPLLAAQLRHDHPLERARDLGPDP